jgi:glyceraldehyde-3-phosphate dehydrogenase (NADP+)
MTNCTKFSGPYKKPVQQGNVKGMNSVAISRQKVWDVKMVIGGKLVESSDGRVHEVKSPIDGRLVGRTPIASKEDMELAVDAAYKANDAVRDMTTSDRAKALATVARLIRENVDDLSRLVVLETGKPIDIACPTLERVAENLLYIGEEGKRITGEVVQCDAFSGVPKNKIGIVTKEPIGVVLAIGPFNYPEYTNMRKVAPALAAGNSVILKPSEFAPLTITQICSYFLQTDLPPGAVNVINCPGRDLEHIINHSHINAITFTGSSKVGKRIAQSTGLKKLIMELGGKSPLIVLEDADMKDAVENAVDGAFIMSGQRCDAVSRVLVVESVKDNFLRMAVQSAKERMKAGNPLESGVNFGPLITEDAAKRVENYVVDAIKKGAKVVLGGKRHGNFFEPTILDGVTEDMLIAQDEYFGPLMPIMTVKNFDDAIAITNRNAYGLQAAIFTKNVNRVMNGARRLDVGTVVLNTRPKVYDNLPVTGVKDSGVGSEGIRYAIDELTIRKTLLMDIKD